MRRDWARAISGDYIHRTAAQTPKTRLQLQRCHLAANIGAMVWGRTRVWHWGMDRTALATSSPQLDKALNAGRLVSVCWQITFLRNVYYFGFGYYSLDAPCVSGQWWLSQRWGMCPSQARFQPRPRCEAGAGAASRCAAAAASLLNYINRPPSSVIFYYMGKKKKMGWAGKNSCFHSANTSKRVAHRTSHETFLRRMLGSPLSG